MPIKKYKPTTPSRRFMTGLTYEEITAHEPYKPLTVYKKATKVLDTKNCTVL